MAMIPTAPEKVRGVTPKLLKSKGVTEFTKNAAHIAITSIDAAFISIPNYRKKTKWAWWDLNPRQKDLESLRSGQTELHTLVFNLQQHHEHQTQSTPSASTCCRSSGLPVLLAMNS